MRPDASVVGSPATLLPFILLGVALGVLFDLFRTFRIWRSGGKNRTGGKWTQRLLCEERRRLTVSNKHHKSERMPTKGNIILLSAEDFLFCMLASIAFIILQFDCNSGVFRWYLLLLCGIGFVLYLETLGRLTVRFMTWMAAFVRFAILLFYNHTLYYVCKGILYVTNRFGKGIQRGADKAARGIRRVCMHRKSLRLQIQIERFAAEGFLLVDMRQCKRKR